MPDFSEQEITTFFWTRFQALQKTFKKHQAVLITHPADITYFTRFPQLVPEEREAYLLVTAQKAWLFHHSFSPDPIALPLLKSIPKASLVEIVQVISKEKKLTELLIDELTITVAERNFLKKRVSGFSFKPLDQKKVQNLKKKKDRLEQSALRQAGKIATQALKTTLPSIKEGATELAVAAKLEYEMKARGAELSAFPTIVAFGANGALPHHQPGKTRLKNEMAVLIDVGARYLGYRSDMTRSFWFGKNPSKEFEKVQKIVQKAYQKGIDFLEKKIKKNPKKLPSAKELDSAVRNFLRDQNYGKFFIHTTGHGVGLEIHEPPSISWKNEDLLQLGMAITIEPGVYLPGKFGYRHENTVLLTEKGVEILTE